MDFISDAMDPGRKFSAFDVMDDCFREALAIEVDTSLSSKHIELLKQPLFIHVLLSIKQVALQKQHIYYCLKNKVKGIIA